MELALKVFALRGSRSQVLGLKVADLGFKVERVEGENVSCSKFAA